MHLAELVGLSRSVAEASGRLEKIDRLAAFLNKLEPGEIEIAIAFLSGTTRQGRLGVGGSTAVAARDAVASASSVLELSDVDAAFERIADASGPGSTAAGAGRLRDLVGRATDGAPDCLL